MFCQRDLTAQMQRGSMLVQVREFMEQKEYGIIYFEEQKEHCSSFVEEKKDRFRG